MSTSGYSEDREHFFRRMQLAAEWLTKVAETDLLDPSLPGEGLPRPAPSPPGLPEDLLHVVSVCASGPRSSRIVPLLKGFSASQLTSAALWNPELPAEELEYLSASRSVFTELGVRRLLAQRELAPRHVAQAIAVGRRLQSDHEHESDPLVDVWKVLRDSERSSLAMDILECSPAQYSYPFYLLDEVLASTWEWSSVRREVFRTLLSDSTSDPCTLPSELLTRVRELVSIAEVTAQ